MLMEGGVVVDAVRRGVIEMELSFKGPSASKAKVKFTQADLALVGLTPGEVSAAMRQESFTHSDVESWLEGVQFLAQQALSDM